MTGVVLAGIAVGGALGALARDVLDRVLTARCPTASLPVGILVVNLAGSFGLGLLAGGETALDERWVVIVGGGFLGGFTTFSTFALQLVALPRGNRLRYAAASVSLGVLALLAGAQFA